MSLLTQKTIKKEDYFIEVCKLIDKTSEYRDSKKKKITTLTVEDWLNSP